MPPYSVNHCEFNMLESESAGGALFMNLTETSLVQIVDSFFHEFTAPYRAGALFCKAQNISTRGCCFLSCATKLYVVSNWGTAADLNCSNVSFTSHV